MTDSKPYTYVLLRYRHDPLAGEFANVGVLLHCASDGFLQAKVRKTVGRLTKMFPDLERAALMNALQVVESGIRKLQEREFAGLLKTPGNAASFAERVLPQDDSSLIWSEMGSGITQDPHRTVEKLFSRFVGRYDEETRSSRDDAAVWQPVRERLSERKLADRLQPKTVVSPIDKVEFDHAWKNGAWHCYQPLSFDLATAEGIRDKAARWSGHMTGLSKADEQIRPYFIVGAPCTSALEDDFRRAVDLLKASALQPVVYHENEVDALVSAIESEIASHAAAD